LPKNPRQKVLPSRRSRGRDDPSAGAAIFGSTAGDGSGHVVTGLHIDPIIAFALLLLAAVLAIGASVRAAERWRLRDGCSVVGRRHDPKKI
jgi:hypothetical protein